MVITTKPTLCKVCHEYTHAGEVCPRCAPRLALSIVAAHRVKRQVERQRMIARRTAKR